VELVRDYITSKMNREFELIFYVVPVRRIPRSEDFVIPESALPEQFKEDAKFIFPPQ
jgi:hypothetical protein